MSNGIWGVISGTTGHFHLPDVETVHAGAICPQCLPHVFDMKLEVTKVDRETSTITVTVSPKRRKTT